MEHWEGLLQEYSSTQDLRYYSKVLQTAQRALKADLAPFEIEWITETLLFKPISLLETISSKRRDEAWFKFAGDAFKLLTEIVTNHWSYVENYYEDIMKLCQLSFDPQTRKQAILCVIAMLKLASFFTGEAKRHIAALEEATTCKAPLALLVGTICECHHTEVTEEYQRIWRIYLNMLSSNKNTVTVVKAVLQGILGLFRHFGNDLPISEINNFYDKMSKEYLQMSTCESVIYSILKLHGNLFKERLTEDKSLRTYIWNTISQKIDKDGATALRSVYKIIFINMAKDSIEAIINTEVMPRTNSNRALVKYTALRIVSGSQSAHAAHAELGDTLRLEMSRRVSYERAEAISWYIDSNMKDSDRVLEAAIMYHENLPPTKRHDVVIEGVLCAPPDVRKSSVIFLITQTIQDTPSLEKYQPLWTELLQSTSDPNSETRKLVFEDAMGYLVDRFIEINEDNEVPPSLPCLLALTRDILTLRPAPGGQGACAALLPQLLRLRRRLPAAAPTAPLLAVLTASVTHLSAFHLSGLDQVIDIDNCADEAALCETCKILILAPEGIGDDTQLLRAMQIIFSRNDVEPKLLSQALTKFEDLLTTKYDTLDGRRVTEVINQIEKLRSRKDMSGKEARILHRDVVMFLGKYGNNNNNNIENYSRDISILKMKDLLQFCLPNTGDRIKINLQRLLETAIEYEDPTALEALLDIILTNYDVVTSRASPRTGAAQRVVLCVAHALSRAATHARAAERTARAVQRAVLVCDSVTAVQDIITCISEEVSPGARRMLSDSLEELLQKDPASSNTKQLLNVLAERAIMMITSKDTATIRAGLDITQSLILTMKGSNSVTQEYLPKILTVTITIQTCQSHTIFKLASESYKDDIGLFDTNKNEKLVKELIENSIKIGIKDFNAFTQLSKSMFSLIQILYEVDSLTELLLNGFDGSVNSFLLLACFKTVFDIDLDVSRNILGYKESMIVSKFFDIKIANEDDVVKWEAVLYFMKEYAVILLELQYQKTLQYIADLIKKIKPAIVVQLSNTLTDCLSTYQIILKTIPLLLSSAYEEWCSKIKISNINVKRILHCPEEKTLIESLNIFTKIFKNIKIYDTKKWTPALLEAYKIQYYQGLQMKMSVFSDILTISSHLLTQSDIKLMFLSNKHGLEFCRIFMNVYFDVLVGKPFVLLESDNDSCLLLLDIVVCCLKRKCPVVCGNVLELVDKLWPRFEEKASFNEKHALLQHLIRFPNTDVHCKPMQWAVGVIKCKEASRHEKIRLIELLPAGDEFSECYRSYASCLPTRLSDFQGEHNAMLGGMLNALAASGDILLFNIVVTLACSDDTQGWWDEALDSCMSALASKADPGMYQKAYEKCWEVGSLGICSRVLVPLLRYSSPRFCEEFFSKNITHLFGVLRRGHREPSVSDTYHKTVVSYIKAFNVLQVVFERVSPGSLESANSILHQGLGVQKPWASVTETCKLAVTLREKVICPEDATEPIKHSCRLLQCTAYNSLTAAICRRRPDERFYLYIFNLEAWRKIVDPAAEYTLPVQPRWRHRSTQRHAVSIEVASSSTLSTLTTGTLRTRLYLRTLTENPLQYDMIQDEEDDQPAVNQELQLLESELNQHECSGTLTALLSHASSLEHSQWRKSLADALVGDLPRNAKWLLAQAICNTEEDLKPFSGDFREALFQLVADTGVVKDGCILLNGLHLDVLNTLTNWDENPEISDRKYLNAIVEYLIDTCVQYRHSVSVYKTLLYSLERLLRVYGAMVTVGSTVFNFGNIKSDHSHYLQIVQCLLKHKIYIPNLLPTLLATFEPKSWRATPRLAEVLGQAIETTPAQEIEGFLNKFRIILEKIRSINVGDYVKVLYSAQKSCKKMCDEKNFRIISDLAQKIDKPKCLSILSSFIDQHSPNQQLITDLFDTVSLCELISTDQNVHAMEIVKAGLDVMDEVLRRRSVILVGECCGNSGADVRRAAFGVVLKAFEGLFTSEAHPPAKKMKTELTPILSCMESEDAYVRCVLQNASRCVLERSESGAVRERLNAQLDVRFTECFFLTIYQPTICSDMSSDLSVCVSALVELLLEQLRTREEEADRREEKERKRRRDMSSSYIDSSKVVSLSSSYQGTFASTGGAYRRTAASVTDVSKIVTDTYMSKTEILDTLLEFSKVNPEASESLCLQMMKRLQAEGLGFDLGPVMAKQLARMLTKTPNNLTPFVLETCRVFIDDLYRIDGFKKSVETLKQYTKGTEGAGLTNLLYEDVMLRCGGPEMFELGIIKEEPLDYKMDDEEFSLEDLIASFGKLSDWEDLRIQDKRRVYESGLPVLWTDDEDFKQRLEDYISRRDDPRDTLWFDKMATAYSGGGKQDSMRWLREIDQWPTKHFVMSAVCEAVQWQQQLTAPPAACQLPTSHCLAEWAARLMIRSAYLIQKDTTEESNSLTVSSACRSQELAWCVAANQRELPELALQCIKRNKDHLHENETLSWLEQKVIALKTIGLKNADHGTLKNALDTAEKYRRLSEYSSPYVIIGMEKLILQLNYELKSLPKSKLDGIMQEVARHAAPEGTPMSSANAEVLKSVYDLAIVYYDELSKEEMDMNEDIIHKMADMLGVQIEYNLTCNFDILLSMLLNRLDSLDKVLSEDTARSILDKVLRITDKLDSFTLDHIRRLQHIFPSPVLSAHSSLFAPSDGSLETCRQYLQLVCDPAYTLLSYVSMLERATDAETWKKTFDALKMNIYENPHAGSGYEWLRKYKNKLYELYNYNKSKQTSTTLRQIIEDLSRRPAQSTLQLSQLCPALVSSDTLAHHESALRKLLAIPTNVTLVKFYDEVSVFTDSVRRPCVSRALLSTGRRARRVHKRGEPLALDAALQRCAAALPRICRSAAFRGYTVTPLSEDSGLIEYLEDYERLRSLMLSVHNLDEGISRPGDNQLILSPAQSLQSFKQICAKIPKYVLRSAMEQNSTCTEDFISKKRRFLETLSAMSIINWIFGVGDRHLENIMYSIQDGGVCGVDWSALLQYGAAELPPARLSAAILAVCDSSVLEARIQTILSCLRNSSRMFLAFVNQSFKWVAEDFEEKFVYIRDTIQGRALSFQVTKDSLQKSQRQHKDKYVELLNQVFETYEEKEIYSVEEQVSCFLQQCTDQRILSVTRRGWQPWV